MAKFRLLAVWMLLLAGGYGANAARLHTTNQKVKAQEFSNVTSFLLPGQFSPLDAESGFVSGYVARHQMGPEASDQGYYGFIATMDVYGFNLSSEQYTAGEITLSDPGDGAPTSLNVVQIGWDVSPKIYGDSHTHLGGLWTTDGYRKTGCPNVGCGFQPEKGAPIALGGVIGTVSQPKGLKQTITIKIIKDGKMGDWLVYYGLNQDDPALIGRFPRALFTGGMADRATYIQFGGYVQTLSTNLVPMGSGYLPTGDAMASASMSNIKFIDQNGIPSLVVQDSLADVTDSNIYRVTPISNGRFSFGGPLQPNRNTSFYFLNKGCDVTNMSPAPWPTPRSLRQATQLHALLTASGRLLHPLAAAHLLNSLANLISPTDPLHLRYALSLFDRMPSSTFLFDTALRACFRASSCPDRPILLYRRMRRTGVPPDAFTFHFLFRCCTRGRAHVLLSQMLHAACFRTMYPSALPLIASSVIHMYTELGLPGDAHRAFHEIPIKDAVAWTTVISGLAKMGLLDDAQRLLAQAPARNVVSWTGLISGYSRAGRATEAVDCFNRMLSDGVAPDEVTVIGVLSACAQLKDLDFGRSLHMLVGEKRMLLGDKLVVALIDMYTKCGDIGHAREVFDASGRGRGPQPWNAMIDGYCKLGHVEVAHSLFDQMGDHDAITFNSLITGYIHCGRLREAIILFTQMRRQGLRGDNFTMVSLLTASASLGALPQGRALHACIEKRLVEADVYLGTALLDMYMKCGRVEEATAVFQRMSVRDEHTWSAMIGGLAFNGMGKAALEQFFWMKSDGFHPNSVTYIAVLTACSHSCLLDEGRIYFDEMRLLHNMRPQIEHYGCMIDLLGRSGHLDEAMDLVRTMPMQPNAVIWASILSACRVHKAVDLARNVADHLLKLEPDGDAVYVQMYNIYIDSRQWEDASKIRRLMEDRGVKKTAGYSSIAVAGQVHKFIVGDRSHPQIMDIIAMMEEITHRLKSVGYSPITSQITVDVDEEEKEHALLAHSEKLAIAFGLISLAPNLPVHIIKNLRVCEDCHSAIKLISKLWNREIIVRDRSRFHHFRNGACSCNDFW